jgi:hypothetical protein
MENDRPVPSGFAADAISIPRYAALRQLSRWLKMQSIWLMPWDSIASPSWGTTGGARTAYTMGALFPERLSALAALSVGYQPRGIFKVPDF